jgi:signal transduction histidine kinase
MQKLPVADCPNQQIIISASDSRGQMEIKVDENGEGISEVDQQNLFKPFFTLNPTGA